MKSFLFYIILALITLFFQPFAPRGWAAFVDLPPMIESGNTITSTTSDAEKELTAETGTWKLKGIREQNSLEEKVTTYVFQPNHDVIVKTSTGKSSTERWSIEAGGKGDTQIRIGSELYRLYFKTEKGNTEMRLAKLANSKAEPSEFRDYERSSHGDF